MFELLSPRLWIALALAGTHWFAHHAGANSVQVKWDQAIKDQAAQALAAERENRATESRRQINVTESLNAQTIRARALQAAAARSDSAADSLRNTLAAVTSELPRTPDDASTQHCAADPELLGILEAGIGRLASTGAGLAREAGSHASDSLMYQQGWPR